MRRVLFRLELISRTDSERLFKITQRSTNESAISWPTERNEVWSGGPGQCQTTSTPPRPLVEMVSMVNVRDYTFEGTILYTGCSITPCSKIKIEQL
jgi:hypothetical protein